MDKRKKGHGKLIIACSDPAENFKFIEETLNQVAFLIGVVGSYMLLPAL